ncbi:M23 family metallopeptidase [Cohnella massiliensis]|uniref:M23 family metallopeptidase n=1 Tax=Cohnella massiliensis TaxID=1816691 RepID=UPI0009B94DD7|nr:M23 family metallopeptidase [Cohnella massiliensis]
MAVFKKAGPIRNVRSSIRQRIRDLESASFWQHYKKPILATAAALIAVSGVFVGSIQYVKANSVSYYQVLLNGEPIGDISDTKLVQDLLDEKAKELAAAEGDVVYKLYDDQVSFEPETAYKKTPDDESTLELVAAGLKTHPTGVKLMINGKEVGIVKDKATADAILARVKEKFVPASAQVKSNVQALSYSAGATAAADTAASANATPGEERIVESIQFLEQVNTIPVDLDKADIDDPEELYQLLTTGNPETVTYTVQEGDCIGCIAQKQGVSESLIYANNTWIEDDRIDVGDVLNLTQIQPVLNVQTQEQVTEIEVIDPPVEIRKTDELKLGQSKTVREGTNGKRKVTYKLVKQNGVAIEEELVSSEVLVPAVSTVILKGTKVIPSEGTGTFAWPVSNAKISSYYGKRWGRTHKGIDLTGSKTIMAADNGTIEFVGTKSGYGNTIIINHNNGFKTLYGHLKSFSVKEGQVVSKGDSIGVMGNTGRSTGTHLHFEIHLNGVIRNPTSYL